MDGYRKKPTKQFGERVSEITTEAKGPGLCLQPVVALAVQPFSMAVRSSLVANAIN